MDTNGDELLNDGDLKVIGYILSTIINSIPV